MGTARILGGFALMVCLLLFPQLASAAVFSSSDVRTDRFTEGESIQNDTGLISAADVIGARPAIHQISGPLALKPMR